jgi:3-oxoacyl-[acyl-carrier-protein] synthase II
MFIKSASSITAHPTFNNKGFSNNAITLKNDAAIKAPDYALYIAAMERRRMSEVLKMAIACTKDCLQQANVEQPDAIIVGTSMGCCTHTKTFLDKIVSADGGLLSPSAFILSTHNSIAGQISLMLKNHGYNITYTQNSLSFEHALIDAAMHLHDGAQNILVGAADEIELELHSFEDRLQAPVAHTTYGSSFFVLCNNIDAKEACVELIDVLSVGLIDDYAQAIHQFLATNNMTNHDIDLVLFSNSHTEILDELEIIFGENKMKDYQQYVGSYYTNSAFALHLAMDILQTTTEPKVTTILICNNLIANNLGLQLVKKNETV